MKINFNSHCAVALADLPVPVLEGEEEIVASSQHPLHTPDVLIQHIRTMGHFYLA